jgi:hypothetical protein
MRQMLMRQIVADAIPKFQKITRQMLCDKCSKNDVALIPKNAIKRPMKDKCTMIFFAQKLAFILSPRAS